MFGKILGKRSKAEPVAPHQAAVTAGMEAEIARRRASNPLAGVQIGGAEIVERLMESLKDERGVHGETVLGITGALAGFACAASVVALSEQSGRTLQDMQVLTVEARNGDHYLYGDAINAPLLVGPHSVWSLVGGMAQHLGSRELPDPIEILRRVAASIGSPSFGVPRLPPDHRPRIAPVEAVIELWPAFRVHRDQFCDGPEQWPILFGLAAQRMMEIGRQAIDPDLAARVVLECAAPMSKLDPRRLPPGGGATPLSHAIAAVSKALRSPGR